MKTLLPIAALILATATASAAAAAINATAWARAIPGDNGAAYLTLENTGQQPLRLLAVHGDRAMDIALHEHVNDNGVMRMRPLANGLLLAPHQRIVMAPGGLHVMLMGLHAPLQAGEHFPLTLHFDRGEDVKVEVKVQAQ
ncbi:copper chaperone PCu(A)C [Paludibacterium yongneupense]|uniref:copper chaperone PCu(A)C n=1 Tax=Paludibacterium yongneupense TaxID=400061 RepID=UPI0004243A8D|nr:copper chaperone PCu(A)C [Paludibacterium yongneupense]